MKKTLLFTLASMVLGALPASWGAEQVTICHVPPGNPANVQIITVGSSAVPHHILNHPGDGIYGEFADGACGIGPADQPK